MTSTDTVPAEGSKQADVPARLDGDYNSFRRHIRVGALSLLIITLAAGLFARQQQHAILEYAVNVYDTAFISTNYIHLAQVSFQHYIDQRLSAFTPDEKSKAAEGLPDVLDNLDVVIERSESLGSRDKAKEIKTKIAALADREIDAGELKLALSTLQQEMERLSSRASAVG